MQDRLNEISGFSMRGRIFHMGQIGKMAMSTCCLLLCGVNQFDGFVENSDK